jgi:aminopeptidase N
MQKYSINVQCNTDLKVGFPLKKLDIVGLNDIDCLGMENWGCLFFLNSHFLVPHDTPFARKQRIAR